MLAWQRKTLVAIRGGSADVHPAHPDCALILRPFDSGEPFLGGDCLRDCDKITRITRLKLDASGNEFRNTRVNGGVRLVGNYIISACYRSDYHSLLEQWVSKLTIPRSFCLF